MARWHMDVEQVVESFLAEVDGRMAAEGRTESERREVRVGLREQLEEQLGPDASVADAERALTTLDPPESYGHDAREAAPQAPASGASAAAASRKAGGRGWIWLLALLLLLVGIGEAAWAWRLAAQARAQATPPAAPEQPSAPTAETDGKSRPPQPIHRRLKLREVSQVDYTENREVVLRLRFNAMPDRASLAPRLHLTAIPDDGKELELDWSLTGLEASGSVVVSTKPVPSTRLFYRIEPGVAPDASGNAPDVAQDDPGAAELAAAMEPSEDEETGTLRLKDTLLFRGMDASSPFMEDPYLQLDFDSKPDTSRLHEFVKVEPETEWWVDNDVFSWRYSTTLRGKFVPGEVYKVTFAKGLPAAHSHRSLPEDIVRRIQIPEMDEGVEIVTSGHVLSPEGALQVPVAGVHVDRVKAILHPIYESTLAELAIDGYSHDYFRGEQVNDNLLEPPVTTNLPLPPPVAAGVPGAGLDAYRRRASLDLRALAGTNALRGAYYLKIRGEKGAVDNPSFAGDECGRLLVVSDLAIHARMAADDATVLAWVNSLRHATSSAGLSVTLWSNARQVLARAVTDADGLARLAWHPDDPRGPNSQYPVLVTATDPETGDLAYLPLRKQRVSYSEDVYSGKSFLDGPDDLRAAVWSDRGIYRPGDTLRVRALVRTAALEAPAEPFPVRWHVMDPDGKWVLDKTVLLDDLGAAAADFELPDYFRTGRYYVALQLPESAGELGSTEVSLEDFLPPQIRVTATPSAPAVRIGRDLLHFDIAAEYLFGAPAAGLSASAQVLFEQAPFRPAPYAAEGWVFGDDTRFIGDMSRDVGKGFLDADGKGRFEVSLDRSWRPPARLRATLAATVVENSGRAVTAAVSAMVDPYPFYIGLRPTWEGSLRPAVTARVAVVALRPDATPLDPAAEDAPDALVLVLQRVLYTTALRRLSDGSYDWVTTKAFDTIAETTLALPASAADPAHPVTWAFAVDNPGEYLLTARDPASGAATTLPLYAGSADPAWGAWAREKPGKLRLRLENDAYAPGSTARVHVEAPFAGHALLTVETDHVLYSRVLDLPATTATLDVPVPDIPGLPNAYISLVLVRPAVYESIWSPHRATGLVMLPISHEEHRIDLAIEAPARARPAAPLAVTVRATFPATPAAAPAAAPARETEALPASENAPAEAGSVSENPSEIAQNQAAPAPAAALPSVPTNCLVSLFAVDEGICMLTAFKTPDPLAILLAPCCWQLSVSDPYGDLMPEAESDTLSQAVPGGDGALFALRKRLTPVSSRRYKPLALAAGPVPLGPDGTATFALDLPEFAGELRLMAVAYTPGLIGAAATNLPVSRTVVVQPAVPRFLAPGDAASCPVTLHNTSRDCPCDVTLLASAAGPLSVPELPPAIRLPPLASTNLHVPLQAANATGKALLTLTATSVPASAASAEAGAPSVPETYADTIELPVRPPYALSAMVTNVVVPPGADAAIPAPGGFHASSLYATVLASPAPSLSLLSALDYLDTYPYGCLEQTASGAYPYLSSAAFLDGLPPAPHAPADPDAVVNHAISRILSMQRASGAFALWPFAHDVDTGASLYAIQFLLDAREAGYAVPADPLGNALVWVRAQLERPLPIGRPGSRDLPDAIAARVAHARVLAAAGQPHAAWNARLVQALPDLDLSARADLALTLLDAGDPAAALDVLRQTDLPAPLAPRDASRPFFTPVRDAALLLLAWIRLDPDAPQVADLLHVLDAARLPSGAWPTTQDNAMALRAIAAYHALRPLPPAAPLALDCTLPGDASAPARALSSDHLLELAPEDAPADGLRLHNASTSAPAYAMIAFEGVPVAPPPTHSNALFTLARTFALADGTPYDPATDPPLPAGTIFLQTLVVAPTPAARAQDAVLDQLVLSALLPAGWEIENPTLSTSQRVAYKPPVPAGPEIHREVRDDRLLVFTGHFWGNAPVSYVVTLRATIPGTYVLPPATVSAMYAPGLAADTPPDPIAITVVPAPVARKDAAADASPAPSIPPTPPPATPPGDDPAPYEDSLFYQVNPDDTIDLLAQLFGISADDIRRVNHFAPNTDVTPGQKIVIPPATD